MVMRAGDWLYLGLLGAVGAWRLVEMRISRAHQRALAARGLGRAPDPVFPYMVALHTAILVGAAVEVIVARPTFVAPLFVVALGVFVAANGLRLWVIRTMADHWNVNVVGSLSLGVVSSGPFRFVRHPNYVAVFLEMLALPLIGGAYVTAAVGAVLHVLVLARRIADEERVLLADATYRGLMGGKPRFVPWPSSSPSPSPLAARAGERSGTGAPPA
jgi:methyltransferase